MDQISQAQKCDQLISQENHFTEYQVNKLYVFRVFVLFCFKAWLSFKLFDIVATVLHHLHFHI